MSWAKSLWRRKGDCVCTPLPAGLFAVYQQQPVTPRIVMKYCISSLLSWRVLGYDSLTLQCKQQLEERSTASCVLQLCLQRIKERFLKKGSGELQHLGVSNQHVFLQNAAQKPAQKELPFQAFCWGNLTGFLVPSVLSSPRTCPPAHYSGAMENTPFQNLSLEILRLYRSTI